jgi:hypothetical protein
LARIRVGRRAGRVGALARDTFRRKCSFPASGWRNKSANSGGAGAELVTCSPAGVAVRQPVARTTEVGDLLAIAAESTRGPNGAFGPCPFRCMSFAGRAVPAAHQPG